MENFTNFEKKSSNYGAIDSLPYAFIILDINYLWRKYERK